MEIYLESNLDFKIININQLELFQLLMSMNLITNLPKILKIVDFNFKYNNFTIEDILLSKITNTIEVRKALICAGFNINIKNYYNGEIKKIKLNENNNECYILFEPIKYDQMFYLCKNNHPVDKFEFDDYMLNSHNIPCCGICRGDVIISNVFILE